MDITMIDNNNGEVLTLADERLATINKFRQIINDLPWEDINTGNFRPQRGCSEVSSIRDAFIALGCDPDELTMGAMRQYRGTVRTNITLYYSVEAHSDEAAEDAVQALLDDEEINSYNAEEVEVDLYYGADIEVEVID